MITLRAFRNGDESGEMVTVELRTREEAIKMLDTHGLELFSITGDDEEPLQQDGIKVFGHEGTWYVIDTLVHNGKTYRLLEHEQHGDEALCIAIDEDGTLVMEDISDGINELSAHLNNCTPKRWGVKCPICGEVHSKTEREYTQEALIDDSYLIDDDTENILILCNDCAVQYQRSAVDYL